MNMVEHKCSLQELADRLGVNFETGISQDRAKYTLERDGPNELSPPRTTPEWVKFSKHLFSGFSILLWTAAILSFIVFSVESATQEIPAPEDLYLGFVLVGIIIVNGAFSYYMEVKSSYIVESFKDLAPQFATVYRKGEKMNVHAEELVVGDIVEVKPGDRIPADLRLIITRGFKVDNSALTGESEPKVRTADYTNENPLETRNLVFYSTTVVEGMARGVVIATGDRTVMGRIANMSARMELGSESLLSQELQYLILILSIIGGSLSLLFFFIALIDQFFWIDALRFLVGIIIACVPEGLLPTITMCLAISSMKMSYKNCMVRNLEAIETLGSTSVICSDKSGTLTQNKMKVSRMWFDNQIFNADFSLNQENAEYSRTMPSWMALARAAMLCNRAEFVNPMDNTDPMKRPCSGDPLEVAILRFLECSIGNTYDFRTRNRKVCEIAFNKTIKYQVSIHEMDDAKDPRYLLVMTGAPERVFDRCSTILVNGAEQRINSTWRLAFHNSFLALGELGESVIGVVDSRLPLEQYPINYQFDPDAENFPQTGLRFLGLITTVDPPKASVPSAVAKCKSAGVKVIMITGDHPITAKAIAKGMGIISERSECADDIAARLNIPITEVNPRDAQACVIHGSDLRDLTFTQLQNILYNYDELVFARTNPHQKLIIVEACQKQGNVVAVTGDGVNDTPALKKADIGIAMGLQGSDVSKQSADVILLDDNFASIVFGIEEGRISFDNIKKTVLFTLTSNIAEIAAFLLFIIARIPLPLGALTILVIDLGTNLIPGMSLAFEREEFNAEVMNRPPRDVKTQKILSRQMLSLAFGQLGLIEMAGAFFMYFAIMAESGFWPARLLGLRDVWLMRGINDVEDAYGQEWSWGHRMVLMYTCQTAFFAALVIQQWATVIVCRARKSCSSWQKPNAVLNISLFFNTFLLLFFIYCPGLDRGIRMYPLRWSWLFAPIQFMILIFVYDEFRKLIIYYSPGLFIEHETLY
ncbi:hypothetical protein HELRODRAFT_185638 [Helobdella robusta]|uniref:Sodium/potassium-transporting ATPase subunit alpha n=1 Tax=Helobdella robusta TaxID=6412 RepID=T1FN27_HELRO|nr:hypothetical protein HELRODRAFT_185638 [Helobdella robusta]ESO03268.1 hypothetical protein HELRODRAFT_185638 [Helobdella robusta]